MGECCTIAHTCPKSTQVLNVPSVKSWASWRHITSRFELRVNVTVWVSISFSKQNCSHRHVTVFNSSSTVCNSTNSHRAGGHFWWRTRRIHLAELIALQLTVQLNAWFTLASFGDFCPSNYAVFWWFCHTLLLILVWWFRSLFSTN